VLDSGAEMVGWIAGILLRLRVSELLLRVAGIRDEVEEEVKRGDFLRGRMPFKELVSSSSSELSFKASSALKKETLSWMRLAAAKETRRC
jgi:hypothetical protein